MNIALTGSHGLIGTLLKKRLEAEGHRIVLEIDKRIGKDVDTLENLTLNDFERVDMLIHAAAFCKINNIVKDPKLGHINAQNSFRVMEFCRRNKIPKVVFFSSSRILSKEKNPYTAGKIYGEELCKAYKDCYGIDYLIIRPSTVYGPFWDKTRRLVHIFITNALKGNDLEIYGDPGTKTLDFTYVDDFVRGTLCAINHPEWNKEYNISGGEESNVHELAKFIIQETGSTSGINIEDAETAQPQVVHLDISEIKRIGYSPEVSLRDGIKKTIQWYKSHLKNNPESFGDY
jgi:nucleoside-diphosphate-sugar epimerase